MVRNLTLTDGDIIVINEREQTNLDGNGLPQESIYIFSRKEILEEGNLSKREISQKLLQQFNLDFDRQILTIGGQKCQSRCTFFRKVTQIVDKQGDMDLLLLLCQQTILANCLECVQKTLQTFNLPYLILDGNSATRINLNPVKKSESSKISEDLQVKLDRQMHLISPNDPLMVVNIFDIQVDLSSLKSSKDIQITVRFHWPLM